MNTQQIIDGLNDYLEHPTYMLDPDLIVNAIEKLGEVAERERIDKATAKFLG